MPAPLFVRNLVFQNGQFAGRQALVVSLSDEEQARQRAAPGGNRPTFLSLADGILEGTIEMDVAAQINGKGGTDARGFIGIAFNITADAGNAAEPKDIYEAVYLRMSNGLLNDPPPPSPRNMRAIQYAAHPAFDFSVSRERFPGIYEQPARIATGRWHRLRVDLCGSKVTGYVDGERVLDVNSVHTGPRPGQIGIWVGDGTDAYVANLTVKPRRCGQ